VTVFPWQSAEGGKWTLGEKPWYEHIQEEGVRETMRAKNYSNPADAAMAYHNLLKLQNGNPNVVDLPGEGATPEQMAAFYKAKGRPEAPDAYEFNLPNDVQIDPGLVNIGKQVFHALGASPAEAQAGMEVWNKLIPEYNAANEAAWRDQNEKDMNALRTNLGDKFDPAIAAGKDFVKRAGVPEHVIDALDNNIGTAAVVELFTTLGMRSGEPLPRPGGEGGDPNDPSTMSSAQAKAEADKLMGDPAFTAKYNDKSHPEHEAAMTKMLKLFERIG